jgi:asparagine synthase (glutamine-hydrolysing)
MGFGIPLDVWLRNDLQGLVRDTLLDSTARQRGLLNPTMVQRLVDEHTSGRADWSYRLWNLICLERWCRMFLDRQATSGPAIL